VEKTSNVPKLFLIIKYHKNVAGINNLKASRVGVVRDKQYRGYFSLYKLLLNII
jgi:hypothetical protein